MARMTSRERLLTALRGGVPDRVPCFPHNIRWLRYHYRCCCPHHQLKLALDMGFDAVVNYGQYVCRSLSNDYVYSPGGGFAYSVDGTYGDLPDVNVDLRIENRGEIVRYERTFHTPAGDLHDVIEWARPNTGYGDGPNPHRVEPLVKTSDDVEALAFLFPPPRRDMLADIPLVLEEIGDRALVAASDNTHVGGWGLEALGASERLILSLTEPQLLARVCRMTQDVHLRNLRAMLERGIGVVFDSWFQTGPSNGWSPATFTEVFLPLIRESIDLAHEFGAVYIFQDDGRMRDAIPQVVEAGVDVISGMQPPSIGDVVLAEVKVEYGSRVALMGGLDPCYVFDLGSPEKVREAVRQAIADAGAGGGYVLGTAEAAAPETTVDCWRAAVEAVREFGTYA